jgi:hypothetical protein
VLEGGGGARVTTLSSRDRPRGTPPRDKEEKEEPLAGRGWGRGLKVHGASSCGAQQAGVCMCVEEEEEGGGGIGVFFLGSKECAQQAGVCMFLLLLLSSLSLLLLLLLLLLGFLL